LKRTGVHVTEAAPQLDDRVQVGVPRVRPGAAGRFNLDVAFATSQEGAYQPTAHETRTGALKDVKPLARLGRCHSQCEQREAVRRSAIAHS
jgi:hypothetical protein